MRSAFTTISSVFLLFTFVGEVLLQSPPELISSRVKDQQMIRPGLSVTLDCPVRATKDIMFEWYKGRDSIVSYGTQRIRILSNGALRIKEIVFDDTGIYTCRAVNGFGSVESNTTLLVLENCAVFSTGADEDYEQYGDSWDMEEMDDSKIGSQSAPVLLWINEAGPSVLKRPGTSFRLQCVSIGSPRPQLTWYKDGIQVTDLPTTRWALVFRKVSMRDSGNYTCITSNFLGNVSHSFNLMINDRIPKGRPVLTGANVTVDEGHQAVLECAVQSTSFPHIQWLKQVKGNEVVDESPGPLQFDGEFFNVLQSTFSVDYFLKDGFYHYRLFINNAQIQDSGKYVCLGANHHGYEYHFSFLEVISKTSFESQVPFPIVVAAIVIGIAAAVCVIALLLYCRPRRQQTPVSNVNKDDFIPMHFAQSAPAEVTYPNRSNKTCQLTYVDGHSIVST